MKIPKLFKKAAAFVMAAVTALSIMPATAFAAGDIGTISFSHTYDSNGNAMRYNSSANIGGYTAGGTGNYKYRMFVDGENAFCIQPGVPLKTGNTLKKASSDTWNALSANQKKAVGLALLYGYQGNQNNLSGSDDEKWLATQTLVWEFVTGCREATGSYNQTSTTVYSLHFGSNYANSGARAVYDQIVAMLREHNTIPSFMSGGKNDITKELAYKDGKYSITLNDSNGVLYATENDVNEIHRLVGSQYTFSDERMGNSNTRGAYYCFGLFIYGFLVLIALITLFNIINSIAMSVVAKMKQYGVFRAIGLSNRQLAKMIIAEASTYAITGTICGSVLGIVCNKILFSKLITYKWGDAWSVPLVQLGIIIVVVAIAVILAVRNPIKKLEKTSIVDIISVQ